MRLEQDWRAFGCDSGVDTTVRMNSHLASSGVSICTYLVIMLIVSYSGKIVIRGRYDLTKERCSVKSERTMRMMMNDQGMIQSSYL